MTLRHPFPDDLEQTGQRPDRAGRWWLWSLASTLRNGGITLAFYLAARASLPGLAALAAFVAGFVLRQVLEATSRGD